MTTLASLTWVDYLIMGVYLVFVLGIGYMLKSRMKTSTDFFLSGRSIPAWITGLAFLSANLGAQEVIGMGASGAKYGIATSHFYWVGAIPAMVFVAIFMMPFYYGSRARSVPEYLKLRFDEKTRAFNAVSFATMTIFSSGISMMVMGKLLNLLLGWNFHVSIIVSAVIILCYILLGGLTSAIYNEVLQFFLIVFGFVPLVFLGLRNIGGWDGLKANLMQWSTANGFGDTAYTSSWAHMGSSGQNPLGVEWFGLVMGLGFVLSFGYWCTDFLVVQRAMAADSMASARRTPLIAAVPKMIFPFLVILPGMIAIGLTAANLNTGKAAPAEKVTLSAPPTVTFATEPGPAQLLQYGRGLVPAQYDPKTKQVKVDAKKRVELDYNNAIPMMLIHYFPTGILGLGLIALMASFMSGMAGNVTAFNTVWTYDLYQSYVNKKASDEHLLWMGRATTVVGIALSLAAAYAARKYGNIMDMLQLVFSFVNAPLFATFALGMFWKRTSGHGAFSGLLAGTLGAAIHHGLSLPEGAAVGIKGGYLGVISHFPNEMSQTFWTAIVAFTSCLVVTIIVSMFTNPRKEDELKGLVYSLTPKPDEGDMPWYKRPAALAIVVLALTVVLNLIFW
jgi:solute:Na+ symporter, SSS family